MGKKRILIPAALAVLAGIVFLAGRGGEKPEITPVNRADGVWIEAKSGSVTPTGLEIVFQNTTERSDFIYGTQYQVERREDGAWRAVSALPGASVGGPSIDLHIPSRSEIERGWSEEDFDPDSALPWRRYPPDEMGYDWTDRYGRLPPGEYRIVIEAEEYTPEDRERYPLREPTANEFYLAAEFTIGQEAPE